MAVVANSITVGTSPTLLTSSGAGEGFTQSFAIKNNGATTVHIGGPTVSTASGYPLTAGEGVALDLSNMQDEVYAVAVSGTVEVRILGSAQ